MLRSQIQQTKSLSDLKNLRIKSDIMIEAGTVCIERYSDCDSLSQCSM